MPLSLPQLQCPHLFLWRLHLVLKSLRLAEYWDVVIWIQHNKVIPKFSLHQHGKGNPFLVIVVLPHQAFCCLFLARAWQVEQDRQHLERQAAERQRAEVHEEMQRLETFGYKKLGSVMCG